MVFVIALQVINHEYRTIKETTILQAKRNRKHRFNDSEIISFDMEIPIPVRMSQMTMEPQQRSGESLESHEDIWRHYFMIMSCL